MNSARATAYMLLLTLASCGVESANLRSSADLQYFAAESRFEVAGHDICYVDTGEGEETLLFIHPWAGSIRFWNDVATAFTDRYRVIAVDLPGHGKSSKGDHEYSVEVAADAVIALIDELALDDLTLIGNSLGGGVSLLVVRERPRAVSRLVLIDALGAGAIPGFISFFIQHFATPELFVSVDDGLFAFFTETFVFDSAGPASRSLVSEMLALRSGLDGFAWATAIIRYLQAAVDYDASPWLADIQVPTLILWGDNDWIIWESAAERFSEAIPAAQLEIIEDCGHMPELERPEEVIQRLDGFLRRTPRGQSSPANQPEARNPTGA